MIKHESQSIFNAFDGALRAENVLTVLSYSAPLTFSGFDMDATFDPDLIRAIFKLVWSRRTERNDDTEDPEIEVGAATSKKTRPTTANPTALKVSCELLRLFVTEAIERAAIIAEAEGINKIEPTHFERILPQLLLDF